ncbi:MAG: hypothetical protein ACLFO1_10080 [Spirochaetaceae bacterium]
MAETQRLFSLRREKRKFYELAADRFINRLSSAVRRESWGRTALQLAWTAGPVTYLGLQAGYRIGFGEAAPPDLFLYFAIYTVVAGVFAILIRIGYSVLHGQEKEEASTTLRDVVDKIPDLIGAVRNVSLEDYDAADRRVIAARYILENPDASEAAVGQVIEDVTGDSVLASAARTVEIYRRAGLKTAIWDVHAEHEARLARALERLKERSITVAELIQKRFIGLAAGKRRGRHRTEGFIERVLVSGETDDFTLMTFVDVEEVLTVAFEFLVGREFPVLKLEYVGAREFTDTSKALENARRDFRTAVRIRNSRLRIMAELLNESKAIMRVPAAISTFAAVSEVGARVLGAVEEYQRDLERRIAGRRRRLRFLFVPQPVEGSEAEFFRDLLRLYDRLYQANLDVRRKHVALRRAMRRYDQTRTSWVGYFTPRILSNGERGPGIRLHRRAIAMTESQRLELARELGRILEDVSIQPALLRAYTESDEGASVYLKPEGYKHIGFEVLHALDRFVQLTRSDVQFAVESTNAPNIGALERGLSREVKWGWAVSLVREIRTDLAPIVQRVARNLAAYHGAELTEESKAYIEEAFGVPARQLGSPVSAEQRTEATQENIESQLIEVPPISRDFRNLVQYLE